MLKVYYVRRSSYDAAKKLLKHILILCMLFSYSVFIYTGDTLYSTSGELIDWYVGGSSVNQMAQSVRRLSDVILTKNVIFPFRIHLNLNFSLSSWNIVMM